MGTILWLQKIGEFFLTKVVKFTLIFLFQKIPKFLINNIITTKSQHVKQKHTITGWQFQPHMSPCSILCNYPFRLPFEALQKIWRLLSFWLDNRFLWHLFWYSYTLFHQTFHWRQLFKILLWKWFDVKRIGSKNFINTFNKSFGI
jgi:hypothetical protein